MNPALPAFDDRQARAEALAAEGRYAEACRLSREALTARQADERRRAEHSARDWAAEHDADTLRSERTRQEEAAAASRSASALQVGLRVALLRIEQLGRRIGAERDLHEVLARIDEGVAELLHARCRATWLLDEERASLRLAAGRGGARPRRRPRVDLQAPWSAVARCARLERELVLHGPEPGADGACRETAGGTTLLWPLKAESRLVGVLVVELGDPALPDADRRSLFASFCAFAAVALANARTWSALSRSRAQLAASERHARRALRDAAQLAARQTAAVQRLSALLAAPVMRLGEAVDELQADGAGAPSPCLDEALARHAEAAATACEVLDLTRLEAGGVELAPEEFVLDELLSDVQATFTLRRPGVAVQFQAAHAGGGSRVRADVAALDRTLATLLDVLAERAAPGQPLQLRVQPDGARVLLHLALAGPAAPTRAPLPERLRLRLAVARELVALHGQPLRTTRRGGPRYTLSLERAE